MLELTGRTFVVSTNNPNVKKTHKPLSTESDKTFPYYFKYITASGGLNKEENVSVFLDLEINLLRFA